MGICGLGSFSPGRAHLAMLFCSHRLHDGDGGSLMVESECQCRSQLQAPPFPPHPPRLWSFLGRRPRKHPAKSRAFYSGAGCPSGATPPFPPTPPLTGQPQVTGPTLNRSCFSHTICQAPEVMTPWEGGRGVFVAHTSPKCEAPGAVPPLLPGGSEQFYSSRSLRSTQRVTT